MGRFQVSEIQRDAAYPRAAINALKHFYEVAAEIAYLDGRGCAILWNKGNFYITEASYRGKRPRGTVFDIIMPRDVRAAVVPRRLCAAKERDIISKLEITD